MSDQSTSSPSTPDIDTLEKGQEIGSREITFSRADLIAYAAASGDHNPIHWNERFAREVGLENVIAHGMLTMGTAITGLLEAVGDPTLVTAYSTRFTGMVPVPATGEVALEVVATVGAIDESAGTARVDLAAVVDGEKVLGRARATLALPRRTQDAEADAAGAA